jgi:hypothetical protein
VDNREDSKAAWAKWAVSKVDSRAVNGFLLAFSLADSAVLVDSADSNSLI